MDIVAQGKEGTALEIEGDMKIMEMNNAIMT